VRDQTTPTPPRNIHRLIRGENYANDRKYGSRPVGVIDSRAGQRHFYHLFIHLLKRLILTDPHCFFHFLGVKIYSRRCEQTLISHEMKEDEEFDCYFATHNAHKIYISAYSRWIFL
jgi:hypothetical protein